MLQRMVTEQTKKFNLMCEFKGRRCLFTGILFDVILLDNEMSVAASVNFRFQLLGVKYKLPQSIPVVIETIKRKHVFLWPLG